MLSRVANNLYWMQRYRERAENTARLIEVNHILDIDLNLEDSEIHWQPILETTADLALFLENYDVINKDNVMKFVTFDLKNPNSIVNSVINARENARSLREIISSEMWHELNTFYLYVKQEQAKPKDDPYHFYNRIKRQSQLFTGITDTTLSHGKSWHFGRLGTMLERADMTSRMLDLKYYALQTAPKYAGTPYDDVQWSALLKSVSAFEMYRKKWHQIDHVHVIDFLILDKEFPRSVYYSLCRAQESLGFLCSATTNLAANESYTMLADLIRRLDEHDAHSLRLNLHDFLDDFQMQLIAINNSIFDAFFNTDIEKIKNNAADEVLIALN